MENKLEHASVNKIRTRVKFSSVVYHGFFYSFPGLLSDSAVEVAPAIAG